MVVITVDSRAKGCGAGGAARGGRGAESLYRQRPTHPGILPLLLPAIIPEWQ
ncbi:MAG: hypothetical protein ACK5PS_14635 [Desulfopila sp.]